MRSRLIVIMPIVIPLLFLIGCSSVKITKNGDKDVKYEDVSKVVNYSFAPSLKSYIIS